VLRDDYAEARAELKAALDAAHPADPNRIAFEIEDVISNAIRLAAARLSVAILAAAGAISDQDVYGD
jgi:hypothetical protein